MDRRGEVESFLEEQIYQILSRFVNSGSMLSYDNIRERSRKESKLLHEEMINDKNGLNILDVPEDILDELDSVMDELHALEHRRQAYAIQDIITKLSEIYSI